MDYVYLCKEGDNEELRYSIRSVLKNAPEGIVWLVGGKPDWYVGNHIHVTQGRMAYSNARNILNAIIKSDSISNDFVLMNDDFFVMKPIDEIPVLHGGSLKKKAYMRHEIAPGAFYTNMLHSTIQSLTRNKIKDPLDYELHVPMIMNKDKLNSVLKNNGLWRSLYGNIHNIGGTEQDDVKIYGGKPLNLNPVDIENSVFLSTDDFSFKEMNFIRESFPDKSIYEL